MFRWSVTFFIMAFLAAVLGFGFIEFNFQIIQIGRALFYIFVSGFLITLLIGLKMSGR